MNSHISIDYNAIIDVEHQGMRFLYNGRLKTKNV